MTWAQLDHFFPYLVFFYGAIMVFVLENSFMEKLAAERMPAYAPTLRSHRTIAWASFFIGGLWSLQNLVF